MSPTPDELDRLGIKAWRVLMQARIRHLEHHTGNELRKHERRLTRLETRVAVYASLIGGGVSIVVSVVLHFLH